MKDGYKIVIRFLIGLLIVLGGAAELQAQWKQLVQFDGKLIRSIYFQDEEGHPEWGVLDLFDTVTHQGSVYYSSDTGITWNPSVCPGHLFNFNFTFKDHLTGWFGADTCRLGFPAFIDSTLLFVTHDAGKTWQGVDGHGFLGQGNPFPYYNKSNNFFVVTNQYSAKIGSTDDGVTFQALLNGAECSIPAFLTGQIGYGSTTRDICTHFSRTTDGGMTWDIITPPDYQHGSGALTYKVLPIANSSTFFQMARNEIFRSYGNVYRSDDAGVTWNLISQIPQQLHPVNFLVGDLSRLYVETTEGVFTSVDEGLSWTSICGPSRNDPDKFIFSLTLGDFPNIGTPLYQHDRRLYVADGTGGLWFLDTNDIAPTVAFSVDTLRIGASACSSKDSSVLFVARDLCGPFPASLVKASLSGSGQFLLTGNTQAHSFTGSDSLRFRYMPGAQGQDTARLQLQYTVAGRTIDKTVTLIGTPASATPSFIPILRLAGGTIQEHDSLDQHGVIMLSLASVDPQAIFTNNLVHAELRTSDAIDLSSATAAAPWSIVSYTYNGTLASIDLTRANRQPITGTIALAAISYRTMVARDSIGTIDVTAGSAEGTDLLSHCDSAIIPDRLSITVGASCQSPFLSGVLRGERLRIVSITPNPASTATRIEFETPEIAVPLRIELSDALGRIVYASNYGCLQSSGFIDLQLYTLPSGVYTMKISEPGLPAATASIRVER